MSLSLHRAGVHGLVAGHGRDGPYGPPPAQIRTGGIIAIKFRARSWLELYLEASGAERNRAARVDANGPEYAAMPLPGRRFA